MSASEIRTCRSRKISPHAGSLSEHVTTARLRGRSGRHAIGRAKRGDEGTHRRVLCLRHLHFHRNRSVLVILQDTALKQLAGRVFNADAHIGPSSVDLTLSTSFLQPDPQYGGIHVGKELRYQKIFPTDNQITIPPHRFYLASTKEIVHIPNNMVAWVCGRSSVGRIGLQVQNAGFVDAGFCGQITLELANQTHYPITLDIGMRICQLVLARQEMPSENPYEGKYQRQLGATGSRLFQD